MSALRAAIDSWKQDRLLGRILRNTGYLFSSNTLVMGLSAVQSIFAARLLGVAGFGLIGIIISFVSSIDRLLSFRMGELVVKYLSQFMASNEKERGAVVVKAAALTEFLTALVSYGLVLLLAPLGAAYVAKDPSATPFFMVYGIIIIASGGQETATAVLQVGGHFRGQAVLNVAQSLGTAAVILYAFFTGAGIWLVLAAYMLGKFIGGAGLILYGLRRAGQMLGRGWWRASFSLLPEPREFWRFAFSTNLSGTINLVARDSEVLWVGFFLSQADAGLYKTAQAVINLVMTPIAPFLNTTYPEIARAVAEKSWGVLRGLLKRLTVISAAWTALIGVILLAGGEWLISTIYGLEFGPSTPAALVLLVGYGVATILYWNRHLLLSFGEASYPLKVMAIAGVVKILLGFVLVPRFGYLAQAVLMSAFLAVSVTLIVWRGLREVKSHSTALP
ncbi:MAG: oligosaccharide flippase family protein [Chloroflexota bacterium]